jgi:hypothetical protein
LPGFSLKWSVWNNKITCLFRQSYDHILPLTTFLPFTAPLGWSLIALCVIWLKSNEAVMVQWPSSWEALH